MYNKKAELTSTEIVKIVLAVIGIVLLLYLAVNLYGIFTIKTKIEQSKSNLNSINLLIENLEEGKIETYLIESPKNWYVVLFSKNQESPFSCGGKNCLCFCPDKEKEDCDEAGVCNKFDEEMIFLAEDETYMHLDKIPKQISFEKINNKIIIKPAKEDK